MSSNAPSPIQLLIVDDNEDAAVSLAMLLEIHGYRARTALSGEAALSMLCDEHADFVLLDIGMPGMNGHEVARRIRSDQAFVGVKLIALTGWGQPADREASAQAGFDAHLVKPVEIADLMPLLVR